jgi:hypothetical protein
MLSFPAELLMSMFRPAFRATVLLFSPYLSGCGVVPPQLSEAWEARDVSDDMVFNIKRNIFCETIEAIREINQTKTSFGPPIPDSYGVQLQLTLSVMESTSLAPTVGYNRTFPNGTESGISIGQNFSLGLSGTLSSTSTRTDTTYSYWQVGNIAAPGKNKEFCDENSWPIDRRGSSLLLISDLGIARFLKDNVKSADLLHSSKPKGKKPDKVDVYSYDLKFAVVSGAGISPALKLVSVSGNGMPILNLNRTRTHELLLTFGPTGPDGFQPSEISFSQHLTTELNSAISRGPN